MACAFGMEACKHYYSVRYVRLPDLLLDLQAARDNGTFSTALKKYTKPIVLIIDEWLLLKLTEAEARNLFELIHKRRKKSSTIFCSQFRESEWYQQICDGESTLADAIMDRISYAPLIVPAKYARFLYRDVSSVLIFSLPFGARPVPHPYRSAYVSSLCPVFFVDLIY